MLAVYIKKHKPNIMKNPEEYENTSDIRTEIDLLDRSKFINTHLNDGKVLAPALPLLIYLEKEGKDFSLFLYFSEQLK
jgi:hypothetical protein